MKAHLFGPLLFLTTLFSNLDLEANQHRFLAIFVLVVYNWLFTKIPLYITGLIGVCLTVFMGVAPAKEALSYFADPIIFLFMAGFLFANAMNKEMLDKRVSLLLLSQDFIDGSFKKMFLTLLFLTAFFSMWVSNTATTAMMLPIILGTLKSLNITDKKLTSIFLLSVAYAASIGGLGTPIGSPPNIIAIGLLKQLANINITFFTWSLIGIPIVILFILILFKYVMNQVPKDLTKFDNTFIKESYKKLPPFSKEEKIVIILFALTIFFWFTPGLFKSLLSSEATPLGSILNNLNSGIIGIFFASLLFIFPLKSTDKILKPNSINEIDWPSLLLFGSGLALGSILFKSGLANVFGDFIVTNLTGGNLFFTLLMLVFMTIFSTELTSNTASANILLPIVIAISSQIQISPTLLAFAITFACSIAFTLPIATPPNTIVYGTGLVEIKNMFKLGIGLDFIFGFIVTLLCFIFSFL